MRTAPGSHPDSDSAFPFSPGGAARRPFSFFSLFLLLPSARGVAGARPRRASGSRVRSFSSSGWAAPLLFGGLPAGIPGGLQALRPAGCTRFCRPRRPAAVLPVFPAGQPFFAAFPPFSAACPPFPPARSPRFPAYPLFCSQSRVQAFCPLRGVLHAPEAAGVPSVSVVARSGRFPVGSDRLSPAACPSLSPGFLPPIYKGKKILFPLYKRSRVERERERERERRSPIYRGDYFLRRAGSPGGPGASGACETGKVRGLAGPVRPGNRGRSRRSGRVGVRGSGGQEIGGVPGGPGGSGGREIWGVNSRIVTIIFETENLFFPAREGYSAILLRDS